MLITQIIGLSAAGIGLSQSIPQRLKIRKLGHSHGVSLMTYLTNLAGGGAWFGYGLRTGAIAQVATAPISLFITATVIYAIMGRRGKTWATLLLVPVAFCAMIYYFPLIVISGILLCFSYSRIPQTYDSWKRWKRRDTSESAVSIHTWTINSVASILWIIYGIMGPYPMSTITSSIAMVLNSAILFFELHGARRRRTSEDEFTIDGEPA